MFPVNVPHVLLHYKFTSLRAKKLWLILILKSKVPLAVTLKS